MSQFKLLTINNHKTLKGKKKGYITGILHLAPGKLSGYEVCPMRTPGCTKVCLNTSGRGRWQIVQKSRILKTKWFFENRESFMLQLEKDIEALIRKCKREKMIPVIRLNGTSDIPWENISYTSSDGKKYKNLMEKFPKIQFYDYTKRHNRKPPKNYHLTFSLGETNEKYALIALKRKQNVAVVFKDKLPKKYFNRKVVDGDKDDLRFLDSKGIIIGLKAKGQAKYDKTGFVKTI